MFNLSNRQEAEEAVRVILDFIEGDHQREGLLDTPQRVIDSFSEIYAGYQEDIESILSSTFNAEGYDGIVLLKDIDFHSTCEHHLQPFKGKAHVAYIPNNRVVGISKLARIVDVFGKRLQTQETMTAQIADTISKVLKPKGVAVVVDAAHQCMTTRGIHKSETSTVTSKMTGVFQKNINTRNEFMALIHSGNNQ